MKLNRFEEIQAWQEARKLVNMVYEAIKSNKKLKQDFRLVSQLQAASVSSMANIAEGFTRSHEVASHGYNHKLCYHQSHEELKKDLTESKKLLEDITGEPVLGFRAPNFSINHDALKIIEDCGYLYDSSYNSFAMNSRYGKLDLPGNEERSIALPLFEKEPPSVPALLNCPSAI